ncbi:MAG: hypothetical protein Kow0075_08280 [Salibacteraceae bacterium]
MEHNPLVSITTIVYNGEPFIARCIEGVLNQSYQNIEYVIVNDGSTDGTADICRSYANRDDRIVFIENPRNMGLTYTRNRAFDACTGKYIAVNDADDFSYPDRIWKQVEFMETHPNVVLCGTQARMVFADGTSTPYNFPHSNEDLRIRMLEGVPMLNSSSMVKRSVLTRHGLRYLEGYASCEDFKLFAQISLYGEAVNLPETFVDYFVHGNQQTKLQRRGMIRDSGIIVCELLEDLGLAFRSDSEREAMIEAFGFNFPMSPGHVRDLGQVYQRLLEYNVGWRFFHQGKLEQFLRNKYFEVCYHSTKFSNALDIWKMFVRTNFVRSVDILNCAPKIIYSVIRTK